ILAETTTDGDGVARFAAPLTHGTGSSAPSSIHLFGPGDDFATLDLEAAAFDLSDRGVSGAPHPGPLDGFIWTDRGIYRPGETVQAMALLRDDAGRPADFPARVTVKRPNGQVFLQTTAPRLADDAIRVPITLSAGAAIGTWTIELRSDPDADPIATAGFRVDAFVPDRLAVDLGPVPGPLLPGRPFALPLTARFLYGAPGAGLSGKASIRLTWNDDPFPALKGYGVGLAGETYAPDAQDVDIADTDGEGHSTIAISVPRAPDTTHPIKASVTAEIDDPSGHASRGKIDVPVRPSGNLIGVNPDFADNAIDANAEAGCEADRVAGKVGLDADQVAGRTDGNVDLAAARVAGWIVDLRGDARLDRMRGVGRARHADRDRRVALAVGVGDVDVLRVGRVGLAGQADAIALERRERVVIPGQADRRLARQSGAGRAVQETRREGQRERPAGQQRTGHRAEIDRDPVGHEGVDAEAGGGNRAGVGVGAQLDRPGADRGPGGQGDRHGDRVVSQPGGRRLQEHLSVGTVDGDPRREIGRASRVVAQ